MKLFLKYTFLVAFGLFAAAACRDDDKVRFPDLQSGVNARVVVNPNTVVFNFLDIDNANLKFDVYSENKDIKEITYTATYVDATFPNQKYPTVVVKKIPGSAIQNGKISDVTLTANELSDAFDLPGSGKYLGGGDSFTFFASVELNDGRVFNASNSAPNIATGAAASFTTTFKLFVSCPFSADEAAGTYKVTADPGEWAKGAPAASAYPNFEVVAGPKANQVTLKNLLNFDEKYDVVVDVDPATGVATVAKQTAWSGTYWGFNDAKGYIAGSGFFFSCSGFMTVNLAWSTDTQSGGNWKIEITHQ
jgi:hypothetical protein